MLLSATMGFIPKTMLPKTLEYSSVFDATTWYSGPYECSSYHNMKVNVLVLQGIQKIN